MKDKDFNSLARKEIPKNPDAGIIKILFETYQVQGQGF